MLFASSLGNEGSKCGHVNDAKCKSENSSQRYIHSITQIHFSSVIHCLSAEFLFLFTPSQINFAESNFAIIVCKSEFDVINSESRPLDFRKSFL